MRQPGWTAIVVNYNGAGYLEPCLAALEAVHVPPVATIVVDNASTDDSLMELHAFPRVEVLAQRENLGFAGGANAGLRAATTEFALVLNPDVELHREFGTRLLWAFERFPLAGAIGALLTYPDDGAIQHAGGIIDHPLMTTRHRGYGETDASAYAEAVDVDFVTGAALALRMSAIDEIGGFDETLSPVYYEDVDVCVRLRQAGWRVIFDPSLRAEHHEGVTLEQDERYYRHLHRNRIRFALKHLTRSEWALEFVPAEMERLRHELAIATGDESEVSGAAAIEAVLRGAQSQAAWDAGSLLPNWPRTVDGIASAREHIDVAGQPLRSRLPLVGRLRNWVNNLGPRWYVDPAFEQQRAFNAAVVQALEAQDRLQREQTAAVLLLALDVLGRLSAAPAGGTSSPQAESAPES